MKGAGLTVRDSFSHLSSKEALFAKTLENAAEKLAEPSVTDEAA